METNKSTKRYVALALGFIERKYDTSGNMHEDQFCDLALNHIKIRNTLSEKDDRQVRHIVKTVLEHAKETASALDEFNVSQSGVCDTCGEVILSGQDGFHDHHADDFCCTACYIKELQDENKEEEILRIMGTLTEYGKVRLLGKNSKSTNSRLHFIDDAEKMVDFKNLSRSEFMTSYNYLSEMEYNNTLYVVKMWSELGDIPVDENECIDVDFRDFPKGTHREDIWLDIESTYNVSVTLL